MARRKLIDYLNDPALLKSISVEEMQTWAAEVPYAALVQRLLAQKLLLESSDEGLSKEATTLAVLSSAQPEATIQTIEDFKQMILSSEGDFTGDREVLGHSVSDPDHHIDDGQSDDKQDKSDSLDSPQEREEIISQINTAEVVESRSVDLAPDQDDSNISEFSLWLDSLKALEKQDDEERSSIELEDKELASDALAEVLVSQGHYDRAIAMYEILMLKNPQKSSFFAAQIQKLKAL